MPIDAGNDPAPTNNEHQENRMAWVGRSGRRFGGAIVACAAMLAMVASPARADIDVTVDVSYLDSDSFGVHSWNGAFTFDVVGRGTYASVSPTSSLSSTYTLQQWQNGSWPSDEQTAFIDGPVGCTFGACTFASEGAIYGVADSAFPESLSASVYGMLPAGHSGGAGAMLDVDLTLQPGVQVDVELGGGDGTISILAQPGDHGFAFGSISLYDRSLQDLNAFGAVNNPYSRDSVALDAAQTDEAFSDLGVAYQFTNATDAAVTYQLRLDARASMFVPAVPEPETYAMLLAGLGLLGWRLRARSRSLR